MLDVSRRKEETSGEAGGSMRGRRKEEKLPLLRSLGSTLLLETQRVILFTFIFLFLLSLFDKFSFFFHFTLLNSSPETTVVQIYTSDLTIVTGHITRDLPPRWLDLQRGAG